MKENDEPIRDQITARDGTRWTMLTRDEGRHGHREQRNIFPKRVTTTRVCNGIGTLMDDFKLLFDRHIVEHIVRCTNKFANAGRDL